MATGCYVGCISTAASFVGATGSTLADLVWRWLFRTDIWFAFSKVPEDSRPFGFVSTSDLPLSRLKLLRGRLASTTRDLLRNAKPRVHPLLIRETTCSYLW